MPALRVLIAEDEPIAAALLESLIKHEGHTVCGTVAYGRDAQKTVYALRPDVILMDVHLADGLSGIAATREILRDVSVPVIVISGTDSREEMAEIAESGAIGFMKKPISADELRVNLRLAIHHNEILRKLEASELLHRSLFDNAAVGIYVCHPDGYYLASNRAFAGMLGYSGPAELLRAVHSLDEQVYVEAGRRGELLRLLAKGREVTDFESEVYGRDGDRLWVAEHLAPTLDSSGALQQYEGVVINITGTKEAQKALHIANSMLQNTVDAIADYVAVTDLEGNVILTNRAFEEQLSPYVGQERRLRILPESGTAGDDSLFERFLRVAGVSGSLPEQRGRMRIAGVPFTLETTITRYSTKEGAVVGAVFVMREGKRS